MPAFPKPRFRFDWNVSAEKRALRRYRDTKPGRSIPPRTGGRLLVATWNIANLGVHKRRSKDHELIAEIIRWFDIVAVQEVNDNLSGLRGILDHLPSKWSALFSDPGGNNERMAFVYDSSKVDPLEMVGEVAIPVKDHAKIKLPGNNRKFTGFDRNPYIGAFHSGGLEFALVNVHLYFGKDRSPDRKRRSLEAYATARWADLRSKSANSYVRDCIVLGDFNLPKVEPGDLVYSALRRRGLRRPDHSTKIASAIASDSDYDQILFLPSRAGRKFTGKIGVFDFDGALFADLWDQRTEAQFRSYLRYYVSDHRPLWAEFRV